MYQSHNQASFTEISYYSCPNPIPNINATHFQSLSSDPSVTHLPPPSTSTAPFHTSNLSGFETHPSYYHDINANWVVKEAAPVRYSPAIQPVNKEVPAPISYDVPLPSMRVHGNLASNTHKRKLKRPKKIQKKPSTGQNVRCELCKIECTCIELYEKHLSGKKHAKNIQKIYTSGTSSSTPVSQSLSDRFTSSKHNAPSGQGIPGVPSATGDLETKKKKLLELGTTVQSLRMCEICKVACNGEIVYADHLAGKKHMSQVQALCSMANSNTVSANVPTSKFPAPKSQEKKIKKSKPVNLAECEVCKISCTSHEGLLIHKQGKKHTKNLKLQESKKNINAPASAPAIAAAPTVAPPTAPAVAPTPTPTPAVAPTPTVAPNAAPPPTVNPPTGVVENTEVTKVESTEATKVENTEVTKATAPESQQVKVKKQGARSKDSEDVETKKQKILECGAAADAVRTCTVCNVVCNSETVFKSHLAGQKHTAMMKQAEAASAANGQQLVTSAS